MNKEKYQNIVFEKKRPILKYIGITTGIEIISHVFHELSHLLTAYFLKQEITKINILNIKQNKTKTTIYGNISSNSKITNYKDAIKPLMIVNSPRFLLIPIILTLLLPLKYIILSIPINIILYKASKLSKMDKRTIKEIITFIKENEVE